VHLVGATNGVHFSRKVLILSPQRVRTEIQVIGDYKMRLPVPLLSCNKGTLRNKAPPSQPHLLHPGVDSTPLIKGYTVCILQTIVFLEYAVQPVDDSAINILAVSPG
jgi:hypothetical protein